MDIKRTQKSLLSFEFVLGDAMIWRCTVEHEEGYARRWRCDADGSPIIIALDYREKIGWRRWVAPPPDLIGSILCGADQVGGLRLDAREMDWKLECILEGARGVFECHSETPRIQGSDCVLAFDAQTMGRIFGKTKALALEMGILNACA